MNMFRTRSIPIWVCILVIAFASAGFTQEGRKPLKQRGADKLVKNFLGKNKKKIEKAREAMLALDPPSRVLLIQSFKKSVLEPIELEEKIKKGPVRVSIKAPGVEGGVVTADITLPKGYKKKAFPLLIRSHGAGMGGDRLMEIWNQAGRIKQKFISVTPTMPFGEIGGSFNVWGPEFISTYDAIYRYMLRHFRVDTDRVYLSGYFMGAGFSSLLAQVWPHRFAAMHCSGLLYFGDGKDKKSSILAAHQVPGFFIIGETDKQARIDTHRVAEKHLHSMPGYRGKFNYIPGEGADQPFFSPMDSEAYAFLLKNTRAPTPKSFNGFLASATHWSEFKYLDRCHWLNAIELRNRDMVKVETKGQVISINADHLKKAEVFLNDEIVDLSKPVTINLNGKAVFEGKVERSVEFLLEQIAEERDLHRLYWNKVTIGK